jgi:hypothetical protein
MPATRKPTSEKSESKTKTAAGVKTASRVAAAPAPQRAATTTTAKPKADPPATAPARRSSPARIDPDRRRCYVEVAAYFIAERRGFATGYETTDWLAAEEEIDRLLEENKLTG